MKYYQLTENERYQIYIMNKAGHSQKEIADHLGRHPSTISRELSRNKGLRGYRPDQAQRFSDDRRQSAYKHRKLTEPVTEWIDKLLRQELSPQQIVAYLKMHRGIELHHETVYKYVYADKANGGDLYAHLRIAAKPYRKRYGSYDRRGRIKGRISIDQRPAVVDRRHRIGDWEGDTIIGKGRKSALLTLVERKTLYTIVIKLPGKQAHPLAAAAIKALGPIKEKAFIEQLS